MRQNDEATHILVTIGDKLAQLSPSSSECCIFKVHNQLREVNPKAYEPEIVAIGPYHRGKDNLKMMEEHKLRYLRFRLEDKNENVKRYVDALRGLEAEARKCYAEKLNLNTNEMIEMMLLDGFFIIELFRKFGRKDLREENDTVFQMSWIFSSLKRDLMLFENQLPFFVLCKLFDMIENTDNHLGLVLLARNFYDNIFPGPRNNSIYSNGQLKKINHLLGLIHDYWLPMPNIEENPTKNEEWRYIQCATKLREAGITFKKDDNKNLLDIKFESGVMQIPTLRVADRTESFFRNLIAYEQYGPHNFRFKFTDYLNFMDRLINSSEDVTLLCRHGIIDNCLGDDEAVSTLFNKITDFVIMSSTHFNYAKTFEDVNRYCNRRRYGWMANLRRNYFSSPWAIISVLAAFVLLALTITQTLFAIIGK